MILTKPQLIALTLKNKVYRKPCNECGKEMLMPKHNDLIFCNNCVDDVFPGTPEDSKEITIIKCEP